MSGCISDKWINNCVPLCLSIHLSTYLSIWLRRCQWLRATGEFVILRIIMAVNTSAADEIVAGTLSARRCAFFPTSLVSWSSSVQCSSSVHCMRWRTDALSPRLDGASCGPRPPRGRLCIDTHRQLFWRLNEPDNAQWPFLIALFIARALSRLDRRPN